MSIPRRIRRFVPNLVPIGPAVWQLRQTFEFVTARTPPPPKCPWGNVGRIVFSLCPFQDESADVNQSWCQSVQPFDSFSRLLNLWPPKTPPNAPWDIEGRIVFSLCPFPDESADVYQIWCQSIQLCVSFSRLLNWWPLKTPWGIEGRIVFSLCQFPDESADFNQIWCQSVQPFDSFPKHLNLWSPRTPPELPLGYYGANCILPMSIPRWIRRRVPNWCQLVQPFDNFPRLLNFDPLPPPPQMPPGVLRGDLDLAYVHSQMNPQTWTKVGANRSSRLTAFPDFRMFNP